YDNPKAWKKLMKNAMAKDFSWEKSADKYIEMYRALTGIKKEEPKPKKPRKPRKTASFEKSIADDNDASKKAWAEETASKDNTVI
ncbi:MAG: hypothetical protein IKR46_02090, partial [Clostridia bacterium]|nr:hypothetical protein [Clostridia bacterium]